MPTLGQEKEDTTDEILREAKQVIETQFPGYWRPTEACLSTVAQLKIQGISNCFMLVFIGSPGCRKTTMLSWFNKLHYLKNDGKIVVPISYQSDEFSPKAFVSQYASIQKDKLKDIDLLPKLVGKVFLTPDLTTLFNLPSESLTESFGKLTRILDGHGYLTDSGVHGQRGYEGVEGSHVFHWLACVPYVPHPVWRILGNMGPRIYYWQIPEKKKFSVEQLVACHDEDFPSKSKLCREAVHKVINHLWEKYPEKIEWEHEKDETEAREVIARMAMLLPKLRGTIEYQYENPEDENKDVYTSAQVEEPWRCNQILYNVTRGRAMLHGRTYVTKADLPMTIKIALNSAPTDRVNLISYLLERNGTINTKQLSECQGVSSNIALRTMKSLRIIGLVEMTSVPSGLGGGQPMKQITLKDEHKWFLSQEFRDYGTNQWRHP